MVANRYVVVLIFVLSACSGCAPADPPTFDLARYRDLAADLQGKKLALLTDGPYRNGKMLPVYVSESGFELNERLWVKMSPESRAASNDDVRTLAAVVYQAEDLALGFPLLRRSATVEIIDPEAKVVSYRTTVWRSSLSKRHGIISREEVIKNNDACDERVAAFLSRLTIR